MIQRLNFHGTVSQLSLGQVGFNLLRELYKRKVQVTFFPKQFDLNAFRIDTAFGQWLERSVNTRFVKLDRKVPTLACWHINQSEMKPSDKQVLLSFHETDSPTDAEVNIVNQQDHTFFTSNWTVDSFKTYGAPNVNFVPLGLDEDFVPAGRRLIGEDKTHWILVGKWEDLRKMTGFKIKTWISLYGGRRDHHLTLCVNNPFYKPEHMNALYQQVFGGAKPFNVNILPPLKTNAEMLGLYQSADIDLSGYARAEGWNIPAFTATALGKWSIVTNCAAHKDWATAENAILVEPNGMVPAEDGHFFRKGEQFSQGNMYAFDDSALAQAMKKAESKARTLNESGVTLGKRFTYAKTVDAIFEKIETL